MDVHLLWEILEGVARAVQPYQPRTSSLYTPQCMLSHEVTLEVRLGFSSSCMHVC